VPPSGRREGDRPHTKTNRVPRNCRRQNHLCHNYASNSLVTPLRGIPTDFPNQSMCYSTVGCHSTREVVLHKLEELTIGCAHLTRRFVTMAISVRAATVTGDPSTSRSRRPTHQTPSLPRAACDLRLPLVLWATPLRLPSPHRRAYGSSARLSGHSGRTPFFRTFWHPRRFACAPHRDASTHQDVWSATSAPVQGSASVGNDGDFTGIVGG